MYDMDYEYLKLNNNYNKVEQWAEACTQMFTSPYFGLLILTIVLSYSTNNWKKPIYKVMVLHWIIRAFGEGFKCAGTLVYYNDGAHEYINNSIGMIKKNRFIYPRSESNSDNNEILYNIDHWKYAQGCGSALNYIGQIIGDWYLYLRTKTVVDNKKKMIFPFTMLILFNISKASQIIYFFARYDLYSENNKNDGVTMTDLVEFKNIWWYLNIIIFFISFLYETSILYTLKKYVFSNLRDVIGSNTHSFLAKFRKVSLYRLYITTSISLVALIFLFIFVLGTGRVNKNEDYIKSYKGEPVGLDSLQDYAININYYMIYIDQILLKNFAKNNTTKTVNNDS